MSKAYVDTTIVHDALKLSTKGKATIAAQALSLYQSTETPYYALKELRGGPLAALILAYNTLVVHQTIPDAVADFARRVAFTPRKWTVASQEIIAGLLEVIQKLKAKEVAGTSTQSIDEKSELENYLLRKITKGWGRRKKVVTSVVTPLSCFLDTELELIDDQINVSSGKLGCVSGVPCGAAAHLKQHPVEVQNLIDALKPPKEGVQKPESSRRRVALKEVLAKNAKDFPRAKCRALGDAYFCVMAPDDSDILTTNVSDFGPMATALKKTVVSP